MSTRSPMAHSSHAEARQRIKYWSPSTEIQKEMEFFLKVSAYNLGVMSRTMPNNCAVETYRSRVATI